MADTTRSAWDLEPGEVVAVPGGKGEGKLDQYGIVTNFRCREGLPYVISADLESGEVTEDTWETFTGGADARLSGLRGDQHWTKVVKTARSRLGQRWDAVRSTGEHFVRWAHGLPEENPELVEGAVKVAIAAGLAVGAALLVKAVFARR
jgi:hypothetical protein